MLISSLLKKLNIPDNTSSTSSTFKNSPITNQSMFSKVSNDQNSVESMTNSLFGNKSSFGSSSSNSIYIVMGIAILCLIVLLYIFMKNDKK